MQYNKNEIQKTNDKKILRKVKKQWVVVSLASFAFLGGTSLALMSHGVSAYADDNGKNTSVFQTNKNQQSSTNKSDDNNQNASSNDQQNQINQNDANNDNGQSTTNNSTQNQSQNDISNNSNDDQQLSNRLGSSDQSNNQNQTTDIVNNQSADAAANYQKHLQGDTQDANDNNAQYTQAINQGVNDAYSNRNANNDDITDNNSKELYSAAYQGVNADQSKSISDNMASSSIDDIKKAAANASSMLYIAYKYGVDFKRIADRKSVV